MKKQYFINANIVDPHNSINEVGGLIINEDGKIDETPFYDGASAINLPSRPEYTNTKILDNPLVSLFPFELY